MDFALPPTGLDFSQSSTENAFGAGSTIARARPRSHTPTANILQSTSLSTIATSSSSLGKSFEKSQKDSDNKPPKPAMPPTSLSGKGSMGSLGNIAAAAMNDSAFAGPSSSSPLTVGTAGVNTLLQQNRRQKLPIALALNEYVHVWMKGEDASSSVIRVFGTIMMSLPLSTLGPLSDQTANESPLKFSVKNAREIKAILPNKKLIQTDGTLKCPNSSYSFSIDRKVIANWLAEQQKAKPESTFHNVDLVRYELSSELFSAPLFYTAYWKTEPLQTDLRIDYKLNTDNNASTHNALLNIVLSTPISGTFDSLNSVPEAKWNQENQTLTWTLTELSKHGECSGSLKARIKLLEGPSTPANTSVQFQIMDSSMAKLEVCLDSDESFFLSMVRRKIIAGKYFCEPEVR
ncbi:adaptor complexes medium subunit family domain-containing protein [Ditylenchus destructor]|uniref:Adaptor complexes medium subunit family domain-containing protein n=1 Tax=Ditylenchus destructor TaxID=166010 RepID=A0AAD4N7U0_9BILA|nr:adaptor complexes medium subunit family domain-containing protein [Ditylenchus destructor]